MRHLLSAADLDHDQIVAVLDTAEEMKQVGRREIKKLPTLRGRTVVNLFFENSTRTRTSFETAAKRLSADVINFAAKSSSVTKGESLKDTAQTLEAIGADAVVIRHSGSGAPHRLAHAGWIHASVVNAGDGKHEHPTQALLDAFTLRTRLAPVLLERRGAATGASRDLEGLNLVMVGDILHSRVARSDVILLTTLGARITLVAPPTLLPVGVEHWPVTVSYDLDAVLRGAGPVPGPPDAVMLLRVQRERMHASFFPSAREYTRNWGLTEARLGALPEHTIVMHPGPINRGVEISSVAADSPRSAILEQVENGVAVRMAVLFRMLAGSPAEGGRR